ncbi:carboxymuconolactone decarboxylase family protein [Spirosoma sp. KNUC1025]|uniref:carboxymuconolactone decarboxylase family protein n=1 Tax=Spirosoma sp. KNUC1025 TaxID=2894082 RepID=UPI00386ED70A|nr:peroxidase-related enzyme [Spirosoma sp. KNUC1025]
MPHIQLPEGVPGIRSLVMYRPDTGKPLYELAQVLLRGESPLSQAERELIATYVSAQNSCNFCTQSHAAAARVLFGPDRNVVDFVLSEYETAPISEKLKALLTIARHVQMDARTVSEVDVARAREQGATDRDIHDTVLIAATFCMFNRYVDGLATLSPTESAVYEPMGERLAQHGYALPTTNPV